MSEIETKLSLINDDLIKLQNLHQESLKKINELNKVKRQLHVEWLKQEKIFEQTTWRIVEFNGINTAYNLFPNETVKTKILNFNIGLVALGVAGCSLATYGECHIYCANKTSLKQVISEYNLRIDFSDKFEKLSKDIDELGVGLDHNAQFGWYFTVRGDA